MQNTFGVQVRNDDIPDVALYHTEARVRLDTRSRRAALVTSARRVRAERDRVDAVAAHDARPPRATASRYRVDALDPANSGTARAGMVSPKGGATFGPWKATEFYVNAGPASTATTRSGTTITRDADGQPAERVTPLVRAKGAEVGVRTVAVPHLQTHASRCGRSASTRSWSTTAMSARPNRARRAERYGVEIANYYSPVTWLVFDGDVSLSQARFTERRIRRQLRARGGRHRRVGGRQRRRVPPDVRQPPLALLRAARAGRGRLGAVEGDDAGQPAGRLSAVATPARDARRVQPVRRRGVSDIDYYFTSRLHGEPLAGVDDIHFHPAVPRTIRLAATITF